MTIIVATQDSKGKIIMAGDRQVTWNCGTKNEMFTAKRSKLLKHKGFLIGGSGDSYFHDWFKKNCITIDLNSINEIISLIKLYSLFRADESNLLIISTNKKLKFRISKNCTKIKYKEIKLPIAVGSGAKYLYRLNLIKGYDLNNKKKWATSLVEVASSFDKYCGKGYTTVSSK